MTALVVLQVHPVRKRVVRIVRTITLPVLFAFVIFISPLGLSDTKSELSYKSICERKVKTMKYKKSIPKLLIYSFRSGVGYSTGFPLLGCFDSAKRHYHISISSSSSASLR